jgi:hypothetical protein
MVKGGSQERVVGGSPVGAAACGGGGGGGPIGGDGQRRWGGGQRGAATLRVSGSEKRLGFDYHVSENGLPQNWMIVLSHNGYII